MSERVAPSYALGHDAALGPVLRGRGWFGALALGLALTLLLADLARSGALSQLFAYWQRPEYSHGPLVVLIAGALATRALARAPADDSGGWAALPLLAGGLLLIFVGARATLFTPCLYGFLLCLAALCGAAYGGRRLRAIVPALLYGGFAIPLPQLVYVTLSAKLQLISSTLGVWLLNLLGCSALQNGNIIDLGDLQLNVADACSGLRYLFAMVSFGFLVALCLRGPAWCRALVCLSTVPVAVLFNALRICIIGTAHQAWASDLSSGCPHEIEGFLVFAGCIIVLLVEVRASEHFVPNVSLCVETAVPAWRTLPPIGPRKTLQLATLVVCASTLIAGQFLWLPLRTDPAIGEAKLAQFPLTIGAWSGRSLPLEPEVVDALGADDYVNLRFRNSTNRTAVDVLVSYYRDQAVGVSAHSPLNCIPAGGWKVVQSGIEQIRAEPVETLDVNRLFVQKGGDRALVYYWFNEGGQAVTSELAAKTRLFWDALSEGRSDGMLIRVVVPVQLDEPTARATGRLFLTQLIAMAQPHLSSR